MLGAPETTSTKKLNSQNSHPRWLRLAHWLNALAVLVMVTSGWRIYNASPLYGFDFPKSITLGGWLGGALQWHFAAMWVLVVVSLFYILFNLFSGRLSRRFFPVSPKGFFHDLWSALHGRLGHDDISHYNHVQRVAYLFVMLDVTVLVISGLVLWKSVQFPLLRELLGGYDSARHVHFIAMSLLVAFIAVHLVMVALVPKTLLAMIVGHRERV
ncbi:cytochrome b/b6 domain-containing protein [Pseudomonas sp. 10S4]|uniref:cytochrome b/b6 domain-containing protein n=1 Tax=Pseudomonas sp. 10S4 TaxID=3048583 RepID=UPI002AC996B6|nr:MULTISPECIES: cytochrome b/b6 domain-containing protein [unclassified Pseudomonas]MEB0222929.1 cytochrome b/b6 domain-containing protein [Pseudomonas sp. 5S1]MEB0293026.1 cytochrome b/b6 domain-containing protein [Pseudomonas sp. 10S4]WPX17232.1 cytochrome b/b6 domain-containing protein [Pseudomonas sp. 10S4]